MDPPHRKKYQGAAFFALALMSISMREAARLSVYKILGRTNMGGTYLREFGRLVAHMVGVLTLLGVPVDGALMVMLQLSQLFTAASRRAVSTAKQSEREDASSTLQLLASLLGPLYACLKPLHPETKWSGVFNLYLHAALAHFGTTLGKAFPTARHICDDQIDGKIAELNKHFKTRTNNVSRGESLVKKEATHPTEFTPSPGRSAVELMIYTELITVCPCMFNLGRTVRRDVDAAVKLAETHSAFIVETGPAVHPATAVFSMPARSKDVPKQHVDKHLAYSAEMRLHEALRRRQRCSAI